MKNDIEKRIISSKPNGRGKSEFVAKTMHVIKKTETHETFSRALRTTNVTKRERLFMKIKHLPTAAVVILAISAVLIISGSAYAAYRMWLRPETNITSVEQKYGRDQVFVDLKNCYSQGENVQVEINKDKLGNPAEAAAVIGAECEINTIQNWVISEFGVDASSVRFPYTITARNNDHISIKNDDQQLAEFVLSNDTALVVGGDPAEINMFMEGDPVAFVVSNDNKLLSLVKLGYPPQLYNSSAVQNTYHLRHECYGNPRSSCIDLPSLDVLREGEGGANPSTSGDMYYIQGKLTGYTSGQFTLESTSGESYTFQTAKDEINTFNTSNPYGEVTIEKGDVIEVRYSQSKNEKTNEIESKQYHNIQLLLQEFDKKSDKNFQKYRY